MAAKRKQTVGVIFGGRSVEHDVSIVTGHQIMQAFDPEHNEIVPIYIDREGRWFTGEPLLDLKNYEWIQSATVKEQIITRVKEIEVIKKDYLDKKGLAE